MLSIRNWKTKRYVVFKSLWQPSLQRGQFLQSFLVQSLATKISNFLLLSQLELWNEKWDFVLMNFWIRFSIFDSFLRSSAERSDGDLSSVDKRVSFNNDVKIKCIPKKSNNNKSSTASGTESHTTLKEGNKIWVMRYWVPEILTQWNL